MECASRQRICTGLFGWLDHRGKGGEEGGRGWGARLFGTGSEENVLTTTVTMNRGGTESHLIVAMCRTAPLALLLFSPLSHKLSALFEVVRIYYSEHERAAFMQKGSISLLRPDRAVGN